MKAGKRKVIAKGDRLNWTPIKELTPVKLSMMHLKGHVLTKTDLKNAASNVMLVP